MAGEHTMTAAQRRRRFAEEQAVALGVAVGGPTRPFRTRLRPANLCAFFADDDRLLVTVNRGERQDDVGLALAWGLAHAGDRDLWLVLPQSLAGPTLMRGAWIASPLRVWTYDGDSVAEAVVPAASEVVRSYADEVVTWAHDLGDRAPWIEELLRWADGDPELDRAHRSSYLAWHCRGRLVLKVSRSRDGLRVTAGSHSHGAADEPRSLYVAQLTGPPGPATVRRLLSAVAWAAADHLDGTDAANPEHRFRVSLARHPRLLGLTHMERAFPALRPGGQRGSIDFLGVDAAGRLHVVETRLGPDTMLVLRGLDYWMWAVAHAEELAAHFGLDGRPYVRLDFVVGDEDPPIGPYTAGQAASLQGSIRWRFHVVGGWNAGVPLVTTFDNRQVPEAPAAAGPRHAERLQRRLVASAPTALSQQAFLADPVDGLAPGARAAFADLGRRGALHNMAAHVRSSQVFALNVLAPLDRAGRVALLRRLGVDAAAVDPPVFEYADPADRLGEATPQRPHQTQVDALFRVRAGDGARWVALVEVKLSELDFNHCSAYEAEHNPTRAVCARDGPFGAAPDRCWQLANRGGPHRRRYDEALGPLDVPAAAAAAAPAGCWFRLGGNQPMRNVALARALVAAGEADRAVVALCAPRANPSIWRRWAEVTPLLGGVPGVRLADVAAEDVVAHLPAEDRGFVTERYGLDPSSAAHPTPPHAAAHPTPPHAADLPARP